MPTKKTKTKPKPSSPGSTVLNNGVWDTVEMLWNGNPFMVELEPTCQKAYDLDNGCLENYHPELYDNPGEWDKVNWDEVDNLYTHILVGYEKTFIINIMHMIEAFVPNELTTTGESIGFHKNGTIVVSQKKYEIKNCRIEKTCSECQKRINAVSGIPPPPEYSLEGDRYAIASDYTEVTDKESGKVMPVLLPVGQYALEYMTKHCPCKGEKIKRDEIITYVKDKYCCENSVPSCGYDSVISLFKKSKGGGVLNKETALFYGTGKLINNNGKLGEYWLEVN